MLVTKSERTPADLSRVNLEQEWEAHFWAARFRVTPDELRASVAAAGPRVQDVEKQLQSAAREAFRAGGED